MNEKKKKGCKKNSNYKVFAGLVVLAICFGIFTVQAVVKAQMAHTRAQEIIELLSVLKGANDYDKQIILATLEEKVSDEVGQIALGGEVANYCAGDEAVTNVCNFAFSDVLIEPAKDGTGSFIVSVDSTFTGTTTPSIRTLSSVVLDATYPSTSTLNVSTDGTNVTDDIAYYTNTGADLLCTLVWYDITNPSGILKYSYGVGTTTLTAGGSWTATATESIIASTTVGVSDTFLTRGATLNNLVYPGSYFAKSPTTGIASSTMFVLRNGESLVAWYHSWNATSSDSFSTTYNATVGSIGANCWAR